MVDVQFGIQSGTHLQHTAEQGLEKSVDRHDVHIIIVQEHAFETFPCALRQQFLRCFRITQHELPGTIQEILFLTLRDTMQVLDDTLTHLRRRLVGKRNSENRAIVFTGQQQTYIIRC